MRVQSLLTAVFLFATSFVAASPISARDDIFQEVSSAIDNAVDKIDLALTGQATAIVISDATQAVFLVSTTISTILDDAEKVVTLTDEDVSCLGDSLTALSETLEKLEKIAVASEWITLIKSLQGLKSSLQSLADAVPGILVKVAVILNSTLVLLGKVTGLWL